MRLPRSAVICQFGDCVIDCGAISSAVVVPVSPQGAHVISIGFYGGDRTLQISVTDREAAVVALGQLRRGMVSAFRGEDYFGPQGEAPVEG